MRSTLPYKYINDLLIFHIWVVVVNLCSSCTSYTGCIRNETERRIVIRMTNSSAIVARYAWAFVDEVEPVSVTSLPAVIEEAGDVVSVLPRSASTIQKNLLQQ